MALNNNYVLFFKYIDVILWNIITITIYYNFV